MGVKISADSTCDLSRALIDAHQIGITPLYIVMQNQTYMDGVEITREELLYCAAFDDEMFTGIITGAQLHALLEAVYEPERFGNNAAIAFSGFHAAVDHTRPGGQKVLSVTRPDGTPIAPDELLSVTVSAYMASGGNDTGAIAGQIDWKPTGRHYHEAVSAYAKSLGVLTVADYPRLHETGEPENNHAPY